MCKTVWTLGYICICYGWRLTV